MFVVVKSIATKSTTDDVQGWSL